jgi:lauroyl/myristoyl acyltransferase
MGSSKRLRQMARGIFPISKGLGLLLADRRGRHISRERRRGEAKRLIPTLEQLDEMFGPMAPEALREIRTKAGRSCARNSLIQHIVRDYGPEAIQSLIDVEGLEHLQRLQAEGRGVIAATWHAGPTAGAWGMLSQHPVDVLKLQVPGWARVPERWSVLTRNYEPGEGIRILKQCHTQLKKGGCVAMAFDAARPGGDFPIRVPFMGRAFPIARGAGVLSLRSGAPILPMHSRWSEDSRRIVVTILPPIWPDDYRDRNSIPADWHIAQVLANCTEAYWTRYPWELNGRAARKYLDCPTLEELGTSDIAALNEAMITDG